MSTGTLYIVSTPIGNLDDLAPRAKQILESSAYTLCESTEQTRKLTSTARLKKYVGKGSSGTSVMSQAIDDLKSGSDIGLVCNAGTPLISDPGLALVEVAVACGIPVIASPIEINAKIVNHRVNGFLAETPDGWKEYFKLLKDNVKLREEMGLQGRKTVEASYTLEVNTPKLINILKSVLR